jgi:hypothetical protein
VLGGTRRFIRIVTFRVVGFNTLLPAKRTVTTSFFAGHADAAQNPLDAPALRKWRFPSGRLASLTGPVVPATTGSS